MRMFYAFFHSSGAGGPPGRAAETFCRRVGCQVVFCKLKNAFWGRFFEATDF